jgi:uncharacterized membrane protein (DUF2068 family)
VAPAAATATLTPDDGALGQDLADGTRLVRCLRCDLWLRVSPPVGTEARWPTVPSLDEIDLPLRGRALHDRLVLRGIAIERSLHTVVFGTIALVALLVELRLGAIEGWATDTLDSLRAGLDQTSRGPSHDWLLDQLQRLADLQSDALWTLIAVSAAFATMEAAEAIGLWRGRRWAEYLTVVATAALLPLEVHELVTRPSLLKVLTLALNVAVLVWLVWAKRLFGLRGGTAAAEHPTDWPAVLAEGVTPTAQQRLDDGVPMLPEVPDAHRRRSAETRGTR